jgi:hypothetical protein
VTIRELRELARAYSVAMGIDQSEVTRALRDTGTPTLTIPLQQAIHAVLYQIDNEL